MTSSSTANMIKFAVLISVFSVVTTQKLFVGTQQINFEISKIIIFFDTNRDLLISNQGALLTPNLKTMWFITIFEYQPKEEGKNKSAEKSNF